MTWTTIGIICAFTFVLVSAYATFVALRAKGFLKSQIRNQIILVWLVPIFGAIFVILFHKSNDDEDPRDDGGNSSDMTDEQLYDNVWSGHNR